MELPKVSDLLEKINKAIKNPGFNSISRIEYDLLMQHVRQLYDELYTLHMSTTGLFQEHITSHNEKREETIQPELLIAGAAMNTNKSLLLNDIIEKEEAKEVMPTPEKKEVERPTREHELKTEKKQAATTINETIKHAGTLNEVHKKQGSREVHKKLSVKPLKDQIDLNKRFVLLNDLFKGNAEAFSSAINHIDTLPDYESAEGFIRNQLMSNYYWDESAQTTRLFMRLVKQKFGLE